MNLTDILKLNNEVESLNVIEDFLNQTITKYDYEVASNTYLKIASSNNLFDIVLNFGLNFLEVNKNYEPTKYREKIYSYLIDASLNLDKLEMAKEFINKRRELLPELKGYIYLLDMLKYKEKINEDTHQVLTKLKNEILPDEIKLKVMDKLISYYFKSKEYSKVISLIEEIKELSFDLKYDELLAEIYYVEKDYEKEMVICEEKLRLENKNPKYAIFLILTHIDLRNTHKVTILEAQYEEEIDKYPNEELKEEYYTRIKLFYEELGNELSKNSYSQKLKKIKKILNSKEEKVPVIKEKNETTVKIKEVTKTKIINNTKYIEQFHEIRKWLIYSQKIEQKKPFREYLRELFIEIEKKVEFKEIILYHNSLFDSNLFNYKKSRLYDKKIIPQILENTVVKETINKEEDIFDEPAGLVSKKDLLTNQNYSEDIKYIYSLYVNKETVILFYLEEEISDPSFYYELVSGIKTIVELRLLTEYNYRNLKLEINDVNSIINNSIMPIRVLREYNSKYNKIAAELFKIDEKYHYELFLRELSVSDADLYMNTIKRLFSYPNETKIISYKFQELHILEYLFAYKSNAKTIIISFFIDQTNIIKNNKELLVDANIDYETGLLNKNALIKDFESFLNDKKTFILLELKNDLASIYGNERTNKFFIEYANATKKHFNENKNIYRYSFNQILIVFDYNDIRSVDKEINNYFKVIEHLKSTILKYENFKVNAGIVRYPVVTSEKNIDRILKFLDVSLNKAKLENENFVYFIYSLYEQDIFEQEVIDYLNVAIENEELEIRFNQIIDLKNNVVWNYESEIFLSQINIDSNYLYRIAKKRKKLLELEYFHIKKVIKFLEKIDYETGYLIKLTIPISEETLSSSDFQSFLMATLKKHKIPAEFIRLICDIKTDKQVNAIKIEEISKYGLSLDTSNIESALTNSFSAVHLDYKKNTSKWRQYFKEINKFLESLGIALIVKNVNEKEDRDILTQLGIKYISGKLYQKVAGDEILKKIKGNKNE